MSIYVLCIHGKLYNNFEANPIGLHDHWYEHEILILGGEGVMYGDDGVEHNVNKDSFIFFPGDEPHGYRNDSTIDFVFLFLIPNMD